MWGYDLIREDPGGATRLAINQGKRLRGDGCLVMQSIRTPSIANIANFREGLLSAQWESPWCHLEVWLGRCRTG
jgi:hypothetical protein